MTEPRAFPTSAQSNGRHGEPLGEGRSDERALDPQPQTEELDALPVLAPARPIERPASPGALGPVQGAAVQAAAVAATGFVAGAATAVVLRRRRSRRAARRAQAQRRPARRAGELMQVVASRSFLVDVHLLGGGD